MGITLERICQLFDAPSPTGEPLRVLDIGCSNIHSIDVETLIDFVRRRNDIYEGASLRQWANYVAAGGRMDSRIGGLNGAWLGDVLERAGMRYKAFDIFPGYKTELFDLNVQPLSEADRNAYDIVLNFGTTEHVLGQYNAFKVIHDAVRPGGLIFHELPMTGHLNHGFFNYNPVALIAIAEANSYEVLRFSFAGGLDEESIEGRLIPSYRDLPSYAPVSDTDGWTKTRIPTTSVSLLVRKLTDAPFRVSLETSTTVGDVDGAIAAEYGPERDQKAPDLDLNDRLHEALRRINDPELEPQFLDSIYADFVAINPKRPFPLTIERRMIRDALERFPGDDHLVAQAERVERQLRERWPLMRAVDAKADHGLAYGDPRLDGLEEAFDLSGEPEARFARIVSLYRAYAEHSAVELFPVRIEAEGLFHMAAQGQSDPHLMVRLGAAMAEVTPVMTISKRPTPSVVEESGLDRNAARVSPIQ